MLHLVLNLVCFINEVLLGRRSGLFQLQAREATLARSCLVKCQYLSFGRDFCSVLWMGSESTVPKWNNSVILSWLNNLISLLSSWRDWNVGWHYVCWSFKLRSRILIAMSHRLVLLYQNLRRFASGISHLAVRFLMRDYLSAEIHIFVDQVWVFVTQSTLIDLVELSATLVKTRLD